MSERRALNCKRRFRGLIERTRSVKGTLCFYFCFTLCFCFAAAMCLPITRSSPHARRREGDCHLDHLPRQGGENGEQGRRMQECLVCLGR